MPRLIAQSAPSEIDCDLVATASRLQAWNNLQWPNVARCDF